jgi:alanine racemase
MSSRPGIEQISKWCNGTIVQEASDSTITELTIDSRKIAQPEEALFIALRTARRDGHYYIESAYEKGVRNFLIDEEVEVTKYPSANFVLVRNTLQALQQVATSYRKQYAYPVIGITGSNGKTIIKEWLCQLLSSKYNVVRNPKSYNSQIGVPLSVWLMSDKHNIGIFEAGISQPDEMERLERIIMPEIGIFTNIGEAHSEGFLSQRQKINEKLKLFRHAKKLIYCKDHAAVNECIAQYMNNVRNGNDEELELFTWSYKSGANMVVNSAEKENGTTRIKAAYQQKDIEVVIPFTDPASIENAIHCWCLMLLLNIEYDEIKQRMKGLQPVSMRLELRHGINDCTIINDTYNSDMTSLLIALDYLEQQKQHKQHTVILSDMLQIAKSDGELYDEVAELISRKQIQRFIGIGPALYKHKLLFRKYKKLRSIFFKSTEDFLKKFHLLTFDNEAILLKGARAFTFEKIDILLEQKVHQTILSVNLSAITHNLNVFRAKLKPGVKMMAMVKAFSYGSGSHEIASLLQYSGVDYLSVAYTDEGIALRKAGITLPIMVMSPDAISFDRMIAWKLEPEIFNQKSLESFTAIARMLQVEHYPIHLKLDTGMHRLGFVREDLDRLTLALKENKYVHVASIFSHLAASEDPTEDTFTEAQAAVFEEMSSSIMKTLGHTPLRHLCNSAAIARHPHLHYNMVRLGLGLYGIDGSGKLGDELVQVGTLKTTIAQIKTVPAGDTVGYSRRGKADKDLRIATICIGYADGYPRALSNGAGYVLLHGKKAKTIGVVCMDMCMIDVTDIPEAKEGDEVIVFSKELPLPLIAKWAETIPYEIMTGISQRVKRVYENEI